MLYRQICKYQSFVVLPWHWICSLCHCSLPLGKLWFLVPVINQFILPVTLMFKTSKIMISWSDCLLEMVIASLQQAFFLYPSFRLLSFNLPQTCTNATQALVSHPFPALSKFVSVFRNDNQVRVISFLNIFCTKAWLLLKIFMGKFWCRSKVYTHIFPHEIL